MIDSHVHLDADQYPDPSGAIKRALDAGVSAMVVPGVGPASNRRVLELARKYPGVIFPALGFHPEQFEHSEHDALEALETIARERDSICAVGEVGLPWYGPGAGDAGVRDAAKLMLARFAKAAAAMDLALILHAPHRCAAEALAIIGEAGVTRAVFHWHKSDEQTTRAIINAGYFISLTPEVAYRERDRDLARMLPSNRILAETDGPWPYGGQFAGRLTEPAMIKDVVAAIAHLRCTTFEEIAGLTTANARALFRIRE
ncbi:TatD family hydrolase [Candidatus Binatus soli]|jgi:TatD DNase family protein|uniref:TatD family hydrolase n=1 Tax=Candidatus Binatus soli TaxID=1953413 RepID=UPI003D120712